MITDTLMVARAGECINRAVSTPPAQAPARSAVSATARAPSAAGVDAGTNRTNSTRVVAVDTDVRSESEVGLPNGPSASTSVRRPATLTRSLRMPS